MAGGTNPILIQTTPTNLAQTLQRPYWILPISLNGLGIREGTGVLLFTQIGISKEQALLMELITYVVMVIVSLVGGVFFLVRHFRRE